MGDATVRLLETDQELAAGARIVARQMLGNVTDEASTGWAEIWKPHTAHGAFDGDLLAGTALYFDSQLAIPGEPIDAAAVTAVAVLSNHRRRGHLSRLMAAQLRHVADRGLPAAVLLAAEFPIYGRFGYGPATEWATYELDTRAMRFRDAPTGTVTLADPRELRPGMEAVYQALWRRTPGAITRDGTFWDFMCGLRALPGRSLDIGQQRGALWHDDAGELLGAVVYTVKEEWENGRPAGTAEVKLLAGATPEAERELWRHLTTVDWVTQIEAEGRRVGEVLPLWLHDARVVHQRYSHDGVWLRLLDLPAAAAARRSPVARSVVLEVDDPLGYVNGRWHLQLGPDGGSATHTDAPAELRLSASALGAAFLGGHTLERLVHAGLAQEERLGAAAAATPLLATATPPWCPLDF